MLRCATNEIYIENGALGETDRLAEVRSSSGSAASGLNQDLTWRSGPGRTANLDLDLGLGPVWVRTRFK